MTDAEIMKALENLHDEAHKGYMIHLEHNGPRDTCHEEYIDLMSATLDLIKRQQAKIDELTDRTAIRAIDRIHYNIAEMNLIQESYNMRELKKRFRAEFEEIMELGIEDCINWADWLDSIASEMWEEVKSDDR